MNFHELCSHEGKKLGAAQPQITTVMVSLSFFISQVNNSAVHKHLYLLQCSSCARLMQIPSLLVRTEIDVNMLIDVNRC